MSCADEYRHTYMRLYDNKKFLVYAVGQNVLGVLYSFRLFLKLMYDCVTVQYIKVKEKTCIS